jgi:hypothetical protein
VGDPPRQGADLDGFGSGSFQHAVGVVGQGADFLGQAGGVERAGRLIPVALPGRQHRLLVPARALAVGDLRFVLLLAHICPRLPFPWHFGQIPQ